MVLALPQIQSGLSIEDAAVSDVAAVIRLGSLLAVPAVLVADRVGRRPALIFVMVANVVLTAATGASPSMEAFTALQFLARIFHTATGIVAAVYITEEFPADHRGWGFGALAILAGVGAGLALFMFGMIEQLPFRLEDALFLGAPRVGLPPAPASRTPRDAAVPECPNTIGPVIRDHSPQPHRERGDYLPGTVRGAGCSYSGSSDLQRCRRALRPGIPAIRARILAGPPLDCSSPDRNCRRRERSLPWDS